MSHIDKLIQNLPEVLQNKIFFYCAEHTSAILLKNFKQSIISKNNIADQYPEIYDYDYYMKINLTSQPIPYSYYRDITYNIFNTAYKFEKQSKRSKQSKQSKQKYKLSTI